MSCFAQKSSHAFMLIEQNNKLSDSVKENKYNELLQSHFKNKSFEKLFNDTYMLMRWYNKLGELDKAIKLNKRNLFLMDSINYQNKKFYRQNLYSLGYCLDKENQDAKALQFYNKVLEYNIFDKYAVFSSMNSGKLLNEKNDYFLAAEYFENTIRLARKINNVDYITDASNYLSTCYRKINTEKSIDKAIDVLNNAIKEEKESFNKETTYLDGYLSGMASLHRQLGATYTDKKEAEFDKAMYNYQEAIKYAEKLKDSSRLADIYHDIGTLYSYSNHPKAIKYFDTALTFKADETAKFHLYDNKATFYKRLKDYEKAKTNIQKALNILFPKIIDNKNASFKKEELLNSKDKFLSITSLIHKAEIFLEEAKDSSNKEELNQKALQVLENANYLIDVVRMESAKYKTKLFWRNLASQVYTNAVKACYALNDSERAFYYMEKNKAIILLEDVLLEGQKHSAEIPKTITETYKHLKNDIIKYSNAKDTLLRYKLIAKSNYNRFIDTLDHKYKLYFKSLKPADIIEVKDFQESINNPEAAYVEYILNEEVGYGLVITQKSIKFFRIEGVDALLDNVSIFKEYLNSPLNTKAEKEEYNKMSFLIYSKLFPDDIKSILSGKSITIIPDYILNGIPFEALQTSQKNDDYLIFKHRINYANSLTFLEENKGIKRENNKNAVGFAPVIFNDNLPSLENSKKELQQLELFSGVKLFFREKASKRNFKSNLQDYKIIHTTTHASRDKSQVPYLVLNDSIININELYNTRNDAELVVLSACETAQGLLYKGEGILSLTRSFFNTGAKSVASTLWSVDDKSTSELVENFYKNLKNGQTKSEALHHAKLTYLKNHTLSETSPYYWASMILIGDSGDIEGLSSISYSTYILILMIILSVITFIYFKKSKNIG